MSLANEAEVDYELNLPQNWTATPISGHLKIQSKSVAKTPITFHLPKGEPSHKRTIITANITWNGKNLGPLPDLIVDNSYEPLDAWKGWDPEINDEQMIWIIKSITSSKKFFR